MYVKTFNFGKIPIEMWEFPALAALLVLVVIYGVLVQRKRRLTHPEYKYFLLGLLAKVFGGLGFAAIYIFYYKGGDTTSYYECARAFVNLFWENNGDFWTVYFSDGNPEMKSLFSAKTGYPMSYIYFDKKTLMVVKLIVPFVLISGKSYFLATFFVSVFTYGGIWQLFRTFRSHFPKAERALAIAILFMPSVLFWGSGIIKDSFTLAATCYFIAFVNRVVENKGNLIINLLMLALFGYLNLSIKPYILLILLPGSLVWYFYAKIRKIKNSFFRLAVVPLVYVLIMGGSYLILTSLGDALGKFSLGTAIETAAIIQNDLKQDYYDGNSFDIGTFEPTVLGLLSKSPKAVVAGLYRPFIWESNNAVMFLSGLENFFILLFTVATILFLGPLRTLAVLREHPLLTYALLFGILFAFMIGVTTSNFGAMVRFKIPLIPLYMGTMAVLWSRVTINISALPRAR